MKILIATDAWHPQVNGVVRTLTSLARSASALGADIGFLTPDGFPSMALPTYPGLRIALPNRREIARRIEQAAPDALHELGDGRGLVALRLEGGLELEVHFVWPLAVGRWPKHFTYGKCQQPTANSQRPTANSQQPTL